MKKENPIKEKKGFNFLDKTGKRIKNYLINLNKEGWANILLILFSLIELSLFIFLEELRVITAGIFCILFGLICFLFLGKQNYGLLAGISLLGMGLFLITFQFNSLFGPLILLFMFISCIIFINTTEKTLVGLVFLILFAIASFKILPSFGQDILKVIFLKETSFLIVSTYILGIIFLSFSIYFFLSYFLSYLSHFKKIEHFCTKIRNSYFLIAITLILLISFGGIGAIRENYVNDYPSHISFGNNDETIIQNFICNSRAGYLYFVDGDSMICHPQESLLNYSYFKFGSSVRPDKSIQYELYNESLYDAAPIDNDIQTLRITLSKEFEEYHFFLVYKESNSDEKIILNNNIKLSIYSKEEYNDRINQRVGSLIAIFSIIIFSVFSAMANLKKILE